MTRIYVDFNEMLSENTVLLSREDVKKDTEGNAVMFIEGKAVSVYMDDSDGEGRPDNLIADGTAELNPYCGKQGQGFGRHVKWILKIDSRGIRHESDESDDETVTETSREI